MREPIEFRKIREFGDLIGDTFVFIKQNFKPLSKVFLYLCGLFILASIVSSMLTQVQMYNSITNPNSDYMIRSTRWQYIFTWGYALMILFSILNYTAIYITVLSFISLYIQKGNIAPTVDEVWSYFKFYFFRMLGSGIVMTSFLIICFACCLVPGFYMFPIITLLYPILILENGSMGYSFNRSFKLIKDEWWITAAVILIIWIITYVFFMVLQLPATLILMIKAFTNASAIGSVMKTYAVVTSIVSHLAQIFMIIPVICSAFIYFNLVERKESSGLLNRIDSLGQDSHVTPSTHTPEEY